MQSGRPHGFGRSLPRLVAVASLILASGGSARAQTQPSADVPDIRAHDSISGCFAWVLRGYFAWISSMYFVRL